MDADIQKIVKDKHTYWIVSISTIVLFGIAVYVYRREIAKVTGNVVSAVKSTTAKYSKQFINYLGKIGPIFTAPRGVRNNNPGNINQTSTLWSGEVPKSENTDGRFKQFYDYAYGVRALMLNLQSYFKNGKNTVRKIIETWAPSAENGKSATEAYVQDVAKKVGVSPDTVLTFDKKYINPMTKAIGQHENGESEQWITDANLTKAWTLLT